MNNVHVKEYWASKGDVPLYVYRKWQGDVADKPVLFLAHGSSLSSVPGFDLHVPGREGYSFMDRFAALGFDVWTMDHEGYGRSGRTSRNADVACGVEDFQAVMPLLQSETGATDVAMYGQSGGALRAAGFAAARPDLVRALVLDAFVWTGEGSPTLAKRRARIDEWRASSRRPIDRDFIYTIFERDVAEIGDRVVADAVADAELALGDSMPTGTYVDMSVNLPIIDPADITCPVLIVRGEFDGIATDEDIGAFFMRLPNKDKQLVFLAGQAHVGPQGVNRERFWHVMESFLTLPHRKDALTAK